MSNNRLSNVRVRSSKFDTTLMARVYIYSSDGYIEEEELGFFTQYESVTIALIFILVILG